LVVANRNLMLFLLLCAIWGTTWIGIKAGVEATPPLLFAGTRFTAAGAILLVISCLSEGAPRISVGDLPRLVATSLLMITTCYGALFWGMVHLDTGTAAVLEMSLTPIALMVFAVVIGDESFDPRRAGALVVGVAGLITLFGPSAWQGWIGSQNPDEGMRLLGAVAVASAAITYGWGSVIARPLLAQYPSALIAGGTTLTGGLVLLALSLGLEPGATAGLAGRWGDAAWAGWMFLVLFGSVLGYTIYMRLLRDIGASRAGTYAFVSPVIAVVVGMVALGEPLHLTDVIGMAIMLLAAALSMFEAKKIPPNPAAVN
jgi:drug/metabolite transporter (DMT)-like permease